jgi:hypothetical protein
VYSILSQFNPVHILKLFFLMSALILSSHLEGNLKMKNKIGPG